MTSLGRQVDVTVTGFKDSPLRFNQLVGTINEIEGMLGIPYPAPAVTMAQGGVTSGGFCGHNRPGYEPRYRASPYTMERSEIKVRIDEECTDTLGTIAHEAAHTWFHGNEYANWIDEGLANAIENQFMETKNEVAYPPVTYCETYRNISELEQARPLRISQKEYEGFRCNYSLGDGIFGALREHYGDQEFNERIAGLARKYENPTRRELTIEDVRRVLGSDGKGLEIINTWYGGQPEMRKYRHLDSVEWIHPPTTDGEWLHFSGKIHGGGTMHEPILGNDPFCPQFDLFDGIGKTEWLYSINDPLPVGSKRHEAAKVFMANYHMDPQRGQFQVTARILGNALWDNSNLSLKVKSRVTTGEEGKCKRGIWYSQIQVQNGKVPPEFKRIDHEHANGVQWSSRPKISGNTLTFAGKTVPGALDLEHKDGYCSSMHLYAFDDSGYDWIAAINRVLTDGRTWQDAEAEVTHGQVMNDGSFRGTAKVQSGLLSSYPTVLLVVTEENPLNTATNRCGHPTVLSAIEIQK